MRAELLGLANRSDQFSPSAGIPEQYREWPVVKAERVGEGASLMMRLRGGSNPCRHRPRRPIYCAARITQALFSRKPLSAAADNPVSVRACRAPTCAPLWTRLTKPNHQRTAAAIQLFDSGPSPACRVGSKPALVNRRRLKQSGQPLSHRTELIWWELNIESRRI
jgi:hypothetical protein